MGGKWGRGQAAGVCMAANLARRKGSAISPDTTFVIATVELFLTAQSLFSKALARAPTTLGPAAPTSHARTAMASAADIFENHSPSCVQLGSDMCQGRPGQAGHGASTLCLLTNRQRGGYEFCCRGVHLEEGAQLIDDEATRLPSANHSQCLCRRLQRGLARQAGGRERSGRREGGGIGGGIEFVENERTSMQY